MRLHIRILTFLLAVLLSLPVAAGAWEGYTANRYYRLQLDADERAVYDALAGCSAPDTMDTRYITVSLPEDTGRYSSFDFVWTASYAYQYDNPRDAAWIKLVTVRRPDGSEVPFEELMNGTPDRLPHYDSLILEVHVAGTRRDLQEMDRLIADRTKQAASGMNRAERASFILNAVSGWLRYDYQGTRAEIISSPLCVRDGYAICEGFSKVYKIMADSMDLPCVLSGGNGHMCVQVQMEDGNWYLVEPQGGLLLAGMDAVQGNSLYVPQAGPAHWTAGEGHGAVTMPPIPAVSYKSAPPVTAAPRPADDRNLPWDMGVPQLNGRRFGPESMNIAVYWVQVQLKATGAHYTGDQWDETGSLGSHTQQEIRRFMKDRGYSSHDGWVDDRVVSELAACLGSRLRTVYRGGYYLYMSGILDGDAWDSMRKIVPWSEDSSFRNQQGARWVQTCLSMLGYYSGAVDGRFGSGTADAVRAFQRDHGFMERDYVTYGVARAMLEACRRQGCDLSRLP